MTDDQLLKFDDERKLVFGWAYRAVEPDGTVRFDKQGDFIDEPAELEDMAYHFVLESRVGDEMHLDVPVSDLVESMAFTPDKLEKMGVPRDTFPMAWWVGFHVTDDDVWRQVRDGRYRAFSIGGKGRRQYVESDMVSKSNIFKGEEEGHAFRGNQHTGGKPGPKQFEPERVRLRSELVTPSKPGMEKPTLRDRLRARLGAKRKVRPEVVEQAANKDKSADSSKVADKAQDFEVELRAAGEAGRKRYEEGKAKAVKVKTIDEAIEALGRGDFVEFDQPKEISTLLKEVKRIVDDAKKRGEDATVYDLCRVTVKGTNLFCAESKGYDRKFMPQLATTDPVPGSYADKKPRKDGWVDLAEDFQAFLTDELGVSVSDEEYSAEMLRASQTELNGGKVASIASTMEAGGEASGTILVSSDDYVIDGHHRWAAAIGHDLGDGDLGDVKIKIVRVDMPITEVLAVSNAWAEAAGVPRAGVAKSAPPCLGCDERMLLRKQLLG